MNKLAMSAGRVTVIGSLNMDLVVRARRLPLPGETLMGRSVTSVPGGKGGNQAVAAARLGAAVAMVGRVGADAHGARLVRQLEDEAIDCTGLDASSAAPTGTAMIVVADDGQNAIVIVPGSNGEVSALTVRDHAELIGGADVVVCQMEIGREAVDAALHAARAMNRIVVLNPAPVTSPIPSHWYPLVDFLIPNEVEATALSGVPVTCPRSALDAAQVLRRLGARNVIITLGAQGVYAAMANDPADGGLHYPGKRVDAIDTTAAGDTFVGAFAAATAARLPVADAIRFGLQAAAISVTRAGAQPSIPYLEEVRAQIEG
ncbi:ribokinase [Burkholderia lata]|uniref:ribokinase n=1 Tax=Burkholderia lata (strain ATCC 17760 / DSM 23089 / LMG 22485 / NCIMB 9086 / R18194 / 383) TaxID=482957 RepID=UPI00145405BE|nr:ribokinase [Burkholderia lata]VWL87427.1 ribokinase [Burkholderia lata]